MKRILTILLGIAILNGEVLAQDSTPYGYYIDALRFSQVYTGGTARNLALGGANIALGAEMTSVSGNPAGLGFYNRSEFSFTPGFTFASNNTVYNDRKTKHQDIYGHLDNIGFVFNNTRDDVGGWLGGSFGFSVTKINDFNGEYRYTISDGTTSLTDYFIEAANGLPAGDMPSIDEATDITSLAYNTYLIGPLSGLDTNLPDDQYFSDVSSFIQPSLLQEEVITTHGNQYQWSISYGGNLADVLYIGMGIGIVSLDYNARKAYVENNFDYSAEDPNYDPITSINLTEELAIKGTGANATFGMILRPVSFVRIGASLTTPTVIDIDDRYNATLAADWNNFFYGDLVGGDTTLNYLEANTADVMTRYKLSTPLRASVGAAVFLGKLGFITADIEYLDYSTIWLEGLDFSLQGDNDYIQNNLTEAVNLKAGAEIRLDDLRLRAGYALDKVPVTADLDYKSSNHRISAGAGLHFQNFYADFTVVNSFSKKNYSPYKLFDGGEPNVEFRKNNYSGFLTLGFNF